MSALLCLAAPALAADGFVRDASTGCMVFKAHARRGETVRWQGRCKGGYANGPGVARWRAKDGSWVTFEGTYVQGRLQGRGTMAASGGDRYEGDYQDGLRDGQGVYVAANGERYEGGYRGNQRHGRGVLAASGRRIEGEWRNGTLVSGGSVLAAGPTVAPASPAQQAMQAQPAADVPVPAHVARQRELARHAAQVQGRWIASTMVLLALVMPAGLAALGAQLKLRSAVRLSDTLAARFAATDGDTKTRGVFVRILAAPVVWCLRTMFDLTARIADPFVKAGVRLASCLYVIGLAAAAAWWAATALVAAVGVLAVAAVVVAAGVTMIVRAVLARQRAKAVAASGRAPRMRQRESFFGPRYIEPTRASNDETLVETSVRQQ
jgi:hypothetical protein